MPEQIPRGDGHEPEADSLRVAPAADQPSATLAEPAPPELGNEPGPGEHPAPLLLDEVIRRTLVRSLEETEGNRRRAADLLGISRSTLYRMLTRYSLAAEETRRQRPRKGQRGSDSGFFD